MAGTLVVCEHSLHRPRETGAAWIIKVGCERLVRIIKVGSERSVGSEIGSALPREPSLNSIGFVAQFISELFDLTEAVPELVKNSPAFVAICQMSHLVRTPIASGCFAMEFHVDGLVHHGGADALFLEGGDFVCVDERQADVVEAFQEAIATKRIDGE
jgi:hypothetical protein